MHEQNKRKRLGTLPIPMDRHDEFLLDIWDLAFYGHCYMRDRSAGKILNKFGSGSFVARRHGLTMLWLIALAGRFSELAALKIKDITGNNVDLSRAKGSASGVQVVRQSLIDCTQLWQRRVGLIASGAHVPGVTEREYKWALAMHTSPYLLPSNMGGRLNTNVFNLVLKEFGSRFGCKLSSHCFRDSACQRIWQLTGSMRATQRFMGHKSPRTTEWYLAKEQADQFCLPLESDSDDDMDALMDALFG